MEYVSHFKMAMATKASQRTKKKPCIASCSLLPSKRWQNSSLLSYPLRVYFFYALVKVFVTNYAYNKPIRKEFHHLSIIQEDDKTIKTYVRRFQTKKMEISLWPNYIAIETFPKGIKCDTGLFIELTKTTHDL